jgi:glucosamine 6-phosphate synthetase-like amidotransferase/phosphosugar isomerase protein
MTELNSEIGTQTEAETDPETASMTVVEQTMRAQKDHWREISQRVATLESRDFPHGGPKRILFFGLGSSYIAAKLCQLTLKRDRTRKRVPIIACPSTHVGLDAQPAKGDWVFAFTHRASGGPTMQALELADRLGAFTVQVSAQGVEQHLCAQYLLPTTPLERVEPHTMAVTGAICAVTSLLLGDKCVEEWEALTSLPTPSLDLCRRRAGKGPSVLVGEWEGEWLAREGALKLMEMARLPVRAFGSEEFFHGPMFSTTEKDSLWHISLPKDPRNDEIKSAHQVGVFGSSPLAWMPALLELQWMALAAALNNGVNPDLNLRPAAT